MQLKHVIFVLFALCLLVAHCANGKGKPRPDKSGGKHRVFDLDLKPHSLKLRANPSLADQQSRLHLDFTTNGFPRVRLSKSSRNVTSNDNYAFSVRFGLRRLIEYNHNNASNIECWSKSDTVVSQLSLIGKSQQWTNIEMSNDTVIINETTVHVHSFCTSLIQLRGTVKLCLRLSNIAYRNPDDLVEIAPNRIKLDVEISNYSFVYPDNTRLSVLAFVQCKTAISQDTEVPHTIFFNDQAALDWVNYVNVQTGILPIVTYLRPMSELTEGEIDSDSDDDDAHKNDEKEEGVMYCVNDTTHHFNYSWDPSLGINEEFTGTEESSAHLPMVSSILLIFLALVPWIFQE